MNPQQPQENLTPDEAKASLGLSTRLTEQLLQAKHPPQAIEPTQTTTETPPVSPETAPQPTQQPEPMNEPVETTQPDNSQQIEGKIKEVEDKHTSELAELRKSIENDNLEAKIKKDYEKKIKELEKSHAKEMKSVKDEIKNILNG